MKKIGRDAALESFSRALERSGIRLLALSSAKHEDLATLLVAHAVQIWAAGGTAETHTEARWIELESLVRRQFDFVRRAVRCAAPGCDGIAGACKHCGAVKSMCECQHCGDIHDPQCCARCDHHTEFCAVHTPSTHTVN